MDWDSAGLLLRTNHVRVTPEEVSKTYRPLSIPLLWAYLERKRITSPGTRYRRERDLIPRLYASGLNVPELTAHDDATLTLRWRTLELTDLVHVLSSTEVHVDDKLQYLSGAFSLLRSTHNLGEVHGDPFLKNFFLLARQYPGRQGIIYTCDFEHERDSPLPMVTDILMLAANATGMLSRHNPGQERAVMSIVEDTYERRLHFPFDMRDRLYFSLRFGIGEGFFRYFSQDGHG